MSEPATAAEPRTLYDAARAAMRSEIDRYLRLVIETNEFARPPEDTNLGAKDIELLAVGVGLSSTAGIDRIGAEIARKPAVPFNAEASITHGVYRDSRPFAAQLYVWQRRATRKPRLTACKSWLVFAYARPCSYRAWP